MTVRPWKREGCYDALADELEVGWAPIIGPSGLLAWRRANSLFLGGMVAVDEDLLGRLIGMPGTASRGRSGKGNHVRRALDRLVGFGLASREDEDVYVAVRADLPGGRLRARSWPEMLNAWADQLDDVRPLTVKPGRLDRPGAPGRPAA